MSLPKYYLQDNKHLPHSTNAIIGAFLFCALVLLPAYFVVILPTTILCVIVKKIASCFVCNCDRRDRRARSSYSTTDFKTSGQKRQYDLVMFGATGFTGGLAVKYLSKVTTQDNVKVNWAIAGRSLKKLEAVREKLVAEFGAELKNLDLLIADSFDPVSLSKVVVNTKVIITTVGPFDKYGNLLVELCAQNGTHYCDITGETDWTRKTIDRFDEMAKQSGAHIVHFCGHDCVPWDLLVLECAKHLKAKGETMTRVDLYDRIKGAPSGGTLATMFHMLESKKVKSSLGFDPLYKGLDGKKSGFKTKLANQMALGYSAQTKGFVGPFVMAQCMGNCIRRSNAVNQYGNLTYREAMVYPGFMAGFVNCVGLMTFMTLLFNPPLLSIAKKFLPKPGQGPSVKQMDNGFLEIECFAQGCKGSQVKAELYFGTDAGYRDTARMLVESGLCFVLNEKDITTPGGVQTPATAQREVLLKRLVETGCKYRINAM